jgi:hypothetical protein
MKRRKGDERGVTGQRVDGWETDRQEAR